ncbi:MAG: hypothetical protein EOO54_28730 [Haliea sp.]|nr:MAG: hypothetical protein EOO54_28730 [Haliea sp.]
MRPRWPRDCSSSRASLRRRARLLRPAFPARLASVGRAMAPVELAVVDAVGEPVAPGTPGEVIVRGDAVMRGYWNNPEASAAALKNGWLHTGDIGSLSADGFLTLLDRSKDMIISGGSNIYPREVEEVLLSFPGIAEACVIGVPDQEWGEVVLAYLVVDRGLTPDPASLDRHCLGTMARFKRPKEYRFVDALPKNHYGKVLKTELRAKASMACAIPPAASATGTTMASQA